MNKKILVPTDFSEPFKSALKYAMAFAHYVGAEDIYLLNSAYVPVNPADSLVSVSKVMMEDSEKMFEELKAEISNMPEAEGLRFHTRVLVDDLVSAIKIYSKDVHFDYIVMGTKGASGIEEFLFGTNAADVLENSDVPVLVVPEYNKFKKPQHIVLASDLKDVNDLSVLEPLKNLAIASEAKVVILHISRDKTLSDVEETQKAKLKDYFHGLEVHFQVIHSENIYAGIEMYMVDQVPDIVAVLSRKHGFFESIFSESISKKIAHRSIIPTLSMRTGK